MNCLDSSQCRREWGGKAGKNYRGPSVRKGAWGPAILRMFPSFYCWQARKKFFTGVLTRS